MCGIWALLGKGASPEAVRACLDALSARGPDVSRTYDAPCGRAQLGFTRLAINGLTPAGMQPFHSPAESASVVCNGEIYNYKQLGRDLGFRFTTGSDCEVLLPLYEALGHEDPVAFARALDGVFAIVLLDAARGRVVVARDPYGVRPLYTGVASGTGARVWASEIKGLVPAGVTAPRPFPPGHVGVYDLHTGEQLSMSRFHAVPWVKQPALALPDVARQHLRVALEAAVEKRLLSDRPIGCLLSGGLDSSLIAALVQRALRRRGGSGATPLQTFAIGMSAEPGTDLFYARKVAAHIGSKHHGERAGL
jgi:asparagine synthase (glutamine-hydrolysing)